MTMKNSPIKTWSTVLCITVLMQPLMATAACTTVEGRVQLIPDASCQVAGAFPDVHFIGAPGTCFSVRADGDLKGTGYSGLSQEVIAGADGATTVTPSILLESGVAGLPAGGSRQLLTARTLLSTTKGNLRTADVVLVSPMATTEQLLITGGTNKLVGVSGHVVVTGDSIGQWAPYEGSLCRP